VCHVSVGHVARVLEAAGLPTVNIRVRAFRRAAEEMCLPRTLVTRHPMARPLGAIGDADRQRDVLRAALRLLEEAPRGGTIVELTEPYRPVAG